MHPSSDALALLALGEPASAEEAAHLATCATCAATLADLRRAVLVGRSTIDVGPLERPSDAVWGRIAAELDLPGDTPPQAHGRMRRPARRRRWVWVSVAVVVAIAATGGVVARLATTAPRPQIVADASLSAFPKWAGSSGSAVVELHHDGVRTVTIRVHVDGPTSGMHEVWLMTGDLKALVSLGDLHGSSGVFTIPASIDIGRYDVLDISDEPNDGNPGHSGNSIVRGDLTRS